MSSGRTLTKGRSEFNAIYSYTFNKIKDKTTISPDELISIMREAGFALQIRLTKWDIKYVIGYFKKNNILIPDGARLKLHRQVGVS